MQHRIFLTCLGLTCASSCLASPPLLEHMLSLSKQTNTIQSQKPFKSTEEVYPDLSGVWIGTCDDESDEPVTLIIQMRDTFITINGSSYTFDAISTQETHDQLGSEETKYHMHWSQDGHQLLTSFMHYEQKGNLSSDTVGTYVGNQSYIIEHGKLIVNIKASYFQNGTYATELNASCTLEKQL